ncbi:hypothetical protein [Marinilabilia salmonicolor]|uniref:hypothetical protein n=1 Tax=Marinilabilia salmonicolor TaxID=989 RepID=UPI00029A3C4A|nr:hypothetical protein [Marinilabilia salmonicolor]
MTGKVQYVTQHYWRGLGQGPLFGNAPAFEPSISFTGGKWNIGIFSGASFDNIYKCIMPWVQYSPTKGLTVGIWDIYSPGTDFWDTDITDFNLHTSDHYVDAILSYKFPWNLQLKVATLVLGGDPNEEGKRNYTTYLEANYAYKKDQLSLYAAIGATPKKGLYAKEAGIINLEAKIQYTILPYENSIQLPVFMRVGYNPVDDYFQFVAGAIILLPFNL